MDHFTAQASALFYLEKCGPLLFSPAKGGEFKLQNDYL